MSGQADPYEMLGVPRDAELVEIRAAYHRAALKCHPDTHPDDPAEAARMFARITEAYRSCLRSHRFRRPLGDPARAPRASRGEFAAREAERIAAMVDYLDAIGAQRQPRQGWGTVSRPRLDETRAFVVLWPLGVVVALGVSLLAAGRLGDGLGGDAGLGVYMGVYLLVYAVSLASIVVGLVLTREVVVLAAQIIGYCARRALPGPGPSLPRQSRSWLDRWRRP